MTTTALIGGSDSSAPTVEEPAEFRANGELDRRIRWLDVGRRILGLAEDEGTPLMERVRLLAIFSGLLDEFFGVAVAALTRQATTGMTARALPGRSPKELLREITLRTHELVAQHDDVLHDDVLPTLAHHGLTVAHWEDASSDERAELHALFQRWVDPVLTPLTVDATHPFPYVPPLSLNVAALLRDRESGHERFAQVTVPPLVPQLVLLEGARLVPVEEVVAAHLPQLFAGFQVVAMHCFRVTRSRAVDRPHNAAEPCTAMTRELRPRRFGTPVRLEVEHSVTPRVLALLMRELGVMKADVYHLRSSLSMSGGLWAILDIGAQRVEQTGDEQTGDGSAWVLDLDAISSAENAFAARAATRSGRATGARPRSVRSTRRARAAT
jgi:polyphosphate kinase